MAERGKYSPKTVAICACEVAVLTSLILTIVGLFSIPTVLYALRRKSQSSGSSSINSTLKLASECSDVAPYFGDLCRAELMSIQACLFGSASPLEVPSTIDQEMVEGEIALLLQTLHVLEPSPECEERVKPFLCLQALGLCDSDGSHRTIPQKDCKDLRDNICANEWQVVVAFNVGSRILPVCEDLPDIASVGECLGLQNIRNPQNNTLCDDGCQNHTKDPQVFCPQGFHVIESDPDFCRPLCGVIEEAFTFKKLAFTVSFLSCIILFVLAATAQREELLKLPTILLIYMNGTSFLLLSVIIIGLFNNDGFYCGSKDLFHSAEKGNETGFCTFTGILLPYCLIQVSLWALLHSGFILLALASPFQYRELKLSGKIRYIHIASVIITLLIPLVPGLILLKDGYVITAFPVLACVGRNSDHVYYSVILPVSVALVITTSILVLICWRLLKEMLSSRDKYKLAKTKLLHLLKRAELKIVMILLYYTLTGTLALVTFELRGEREVQLDSIFRSRSDTNSSNATVLFPTLGSLGSLSDAAITTLACLPIVIFLFSFNLTACVNKLKTKKRIRAAYSRIFAKKNNNNVS